MWLPHQLILMVQATHHQSQSSLLCSTCDPVHDCPLNLCCCSSPSHWAAGTLASSYLWVSQAPSLLDNCIRLPGLPVESATHWMVETRGIEFLGVEEAGREGPCAQIFQFYRDTRHWTKTCPNPVWPHLHYIPNNLLLDEVVF